MTARDISKSWQAAMDRATRGRDHNINEIETLLNIVHLTDQDIPEIISILDCLFAGIEDDEEEVDHYHKYLVKALERLEKRLSLEAGPDDCDAYHARRAKREGD